MKTWKTVAGIREKLQKMAEDQKDRLNLGTLFDCLADLCASAEKPIVLIIDEVDNASNNQVFIDFLAQLREFYIERFDMPTFRSVILAGVYDIKNLKSKIRPDSEHRYNSPWNIAAVFKVDMSFSVSDIAGMLMEYESEHHTGMKVDKIAEEIFEYTDGYPFLVSYICHVMDEELPGTNRFHSQENVWTREGVSEAVKRILGQPATLFDSMCRQIDMYPELRQMIYAILFQGKSFSYNPDKFVVGIGTMFGFVKENSGLVEIANRIFEMRLYNLFLSEEELNSAVHLEAVKNKSQFLKNGELDMDCVMEKFVSYFTELYGDNDVTFIEENGRRLFLLYLKPIINGVGNYYVEARTRDMKRTDVVIDYLGRQYIIEMKIWHGSEYNHKGEEQLAEYLDAYHLDKGYLLSFNFNKNKTVGVKTIKYRNKTIVEAVV